MAAGTLHRKFEIFGCQFMICFWCAAHLTLCTNNLWNTIKPELLEKENIRLKEWKFSESSMHNLTLVLQFISIYMQYLN